MRIYYAIYDIKTKKIKFGSVYSELKRDSSELYPLVDGFQIMAHSIHSAEDAHNNLLDHMEKLRGDFAYFILTTPRKNANIPTA